MGKVYKNGIVSPKGFDMAAGEPVDQREIVESISDLTTIPHTYPGIEVKVVGEQYKEYKLIATPSALIENWIEVVPEYAQPAVQTTDTVLNNSSLPGTTTTEALNSLAFGATGTYDEIKAIRDGDRLTPGSRYTITDYQTKYYIEGSNSSGLKIYTRIDSIFGPGAGGYVVFDDYQPLLQAGMILTIDKLPDGYVGPFQEGDELECTTNFSDFYFRFEPNPAADELLVGAECSYSLPRYSGIPDDTITNDANGRPIMQPQGVVNTDVHDGTPYMDQDSTENMAVPVETLILIAASPNSFQTVGFSGTWRGDSVWYDMDLDEVINDNVEVIGSRPGFVYRRTDITGNFSLRVDWRAHRYRRYLLSEGHREKILCNDTFWSGGQNGTFIVGEQYRITQIGNAMNTSEWQAVGAAGPTLGEKFTCISVGTPNGGSSVNLSTADRLIDAVDLITGETYDVAFVGTTDFTLIGSSKVIGATAITAGDICKIATVGDTDYTLIGSPDNVVGTIFTATDVGIGTGTVDIGNNVGSRFDATGAGTGTGDCIYPNLARHPQSGSALFSSVYRTSSDVDMFYLALVPEEELRTLDRWAKITPFNAELADNNTRAKDFTVFPLTLNYDPDLQHVENCEFNGAWDNVILDKVPSGVYNVKSFVRASGTMRENYYAGGLFLPSGGSVWHQNVRGLEHVSYNTGASSHLIRDTNCLQATFFTGSHAGAYFIYSIIGGTSELMNSSSESFSWNSFYGAAGCNFERTAIGCRVGVFNASHCNFWDSAIFIGGTRQTNEPQDIQTVKTQMTDSAFNNVILRFLNNNQNNQMAPITTEASNPDSARGLYIWDFPDDEEFKSYDFNKITKAIVNRELDGSNVEIITDVVQSDNR